MANQCPFRLCNRVGAVTPPGVDSRGGASGGRRTSRSLVPRWRPGLAAAWLLCSASVVGAHDVKLPKSLDELSLVEIQDNVYVVHGIQALPDKNNKGFMSNSGIVLTEDGPVIVDTGGSHEVGKLILAKLRELSDKPVVAVFNTHIHGDHWLGNAAVRGAFPSASIYAHEKAVERLKNGEAERWLDIFMRADSAVAGTTPELPDHTLKGGEQLVIGETIFRIHHTGHAHTDSDIMIELPGGRLLFTGDIVEHGRAVSSDVPQDFDALGQIEAIQYALALPVDTYVPGHGVTGGRSIPEAALRFLDVLYGSVQRHYLAGMQDYEMRELVAGDLSEFSDWFGFDELGRLISFVYLQVEAADFR